MTNGDITKQDIMLKIYENLVRLDEQLKALVDANKKEHEQICEDMKETLVTTKGLTKRIEKLEIEGIKIGIFWKVFVVVGSITASIIVTYMFKIFGVS